MQEAFGDDDSGLLAVDAEVEELGNAKRKITLEIETYCKIVTAIDETVRLMAEIDRAIPSWPVVQGSILLPLNRELKLHRNVLL